MYLTSHMVILVCLLALASITTCVPLGVIDSWLSPGRILWPKDTWVSNPVKISQTNIGSSVSLSFTFMPSTTISNGLLQIILPNSLSGTIYYVYSSFTKNQVITLSTPSPVSLPIDVGIFGPFALIIRSSSYGRIYDINYMFGFIKTTGSAYSSTLTVTNAATNPTVGSADTLFFSFSLPQSLWKYDFFEIVPESKYKISEKVTCTSVTLNGIANILYGPEGNNNLPCTLAAQSTYWSGPQYVSSPSYANSIYIYGLSQDVHFSSGALSVKLSVSTFTYPLFVQESSSNRWKINIWRWGANTLLGSYMAFDGPTTPVKGSITASWTTMSGLPADEVVSGMTVFTKITFTAEHIISGGGFAYLVFSNADPMSAKWWSELDGTGLTNGLCYITPLISGATCVVESIYSARIDFTQNHSGSVSIVLLLTLTAGAEISSITTGLWPPYNTTDSSSNIASWVFSNTNIAFSEFKFHGYGDVISIPYPSNTGSYYSNYLIGADTSIDLFWKFKHSAIWTTSTKISINLPYSSTQVFKMPYIGTGFTKYECDSDLNANAWLSPTTQGVISISRNDISVSFDMAPSYSYYIMALAGPTTALPYIASNLGTFYECYAMATTSITKEIGSSVYSVLIKDWAATGSFVKPLCINNIGSGIPIMVSFTANYIDIDFTSSANIFMLEVQLIDGGDLGTGLSSGSILPSSSSVSTVIATLKSITYITTIEITGLGRVTVGSPVNIFLSAGIYPTTSFTSILAVYYTTSSNPSLKNYLYQSTYSVILTNEEIFLASAYTTSNWFISSPELLYISQIQTTSITGWVSYIGIGLPAGFTVSSPYLAVGGTLAENTFSASSANDRAKGGFVVGINMGNPFFDIGTYNTVISVTGLASPGYSGPNMASTNDVAFTIFAASTPGLSCEIADSHSILGTVGTGSLSSAITCSSSSLIAYGPDSLDLIMTITLKTIHTIPKNGKITLILSASWSYNWSSCTVSGLTSINSFIPTPCSIMANTLTITDFYDFLPGLLTITIRAVPPISAGTYDCVLEAYTQDSASNYIDCATGLSQGLIISASGPHGSTSNNP